MELVIEQEMHKAVSDSIRVPLDVPTRQWIEDNIVLTQRQMTPHPGPYRTHPFCPWMDGILDVADDPTAKLVAIKKGAQVAVTQGIMAIAAKRLVCNADPQIFVQPTEDAAKATSNLRFRPLLEDSPAVAETLTGNPDDLALLLYKTKKTSLRLIGANSPVGLTSFPSRFSYVDEADKIKESVGKEGSPIELLQSRDKWFDNRQSWINGTPTTKYGHVHRYYSLGDQRMYFVPCPKCGHMQVLIWEQVRFDDQLEATAAGNGAYYECIKCQHHIKDRDKHSMAQHGEWRATAVAKRQGYVSFWISGLYSLSDKCTFRALVEKYMTVKDDPLDLKQFWNEDIGVIDEEKPIGLYGKKEIYAIRDRQIYARGTIPTKKKFLLILFADVQASHIPWAIWAMSHRDQWLVDHGTSSVLDDLQDVAEGPYTDRNGEEFPCHLQVIDSGHRTKEVYLYHLRTPRTIVIKGDTGRITTQTKPIRINEIDQFPNGDKIARGKGILLHHLHPRFFRDELGSLLRPLSEEEDVASLPLRLWFHKDIDEDFVKQVLAEKLITPSRSDKYGEKKTYWKKVEKVNDYFDLCHYPLAVRWLYRRDLDKLKKEEERKLREALQSVRNEKDAPKKRRKIRKDFFGDLNI